jgi:hypothetical protein
MNKNEKQVRLDYRMAVAVRDYKEAIRIRRENEDILGNFPPDVVDEIAAIATDPLEPKWMVVEWSVQKNECKKKSPCREYTLRASQFDHKSETATEEELKEWFQKYVDNRRQVNNKKQLGVTLYLVKVEKIKQITNFKGEIIT